jgi:hypothetical protein
MLAQHPEHSEVWNGQVSSVNDVLVLSITNLSYWGYYFDFKVIGGGATRTFDLDHLGATTGWFAVSSGLAAQQKYLVTTTVRVKLNVGLDLRSYTAIETAAFLTFGDSSADIDTTPAYNVSFKWIGWAPTGCAASTAR